jgi:hypothetical protein
MKTKTSMNKLRTLIAAGSFAGFVGGWALLAQSGAPAKAQLPAAVITSAGTVPSQAPGLLRTATAHPAATAVATPAGAAKATSTRAPAATAVKAATAKPKLKTGGSR